MSGLVVAGNEVEEWVPALDGARPSRFLFGELPPLLAAAYGLVCRHTRARDAVVGIVSPGHIRIHVLHHVEPDAIAAAQAAVIDAMPMDLLFEITCRPAHPNTEGRDD